MSGWVWRFAGESKKQVRIASAIYLWREGPFPRKKKKKREREKKARTDATGSSRTGDKGIVWAPTYSNGSMVGDKRE